LLSSQGRESEALACLAMPSPSAAVLRRRGDILLKFRRYSDAIDAFSKALEIDSRAISAWYGKGMAHLKNSQPDDALMCFDAAIGIDQNYVWAWAGKAQAFMAKGDGKNAARSEEILLGLDENFKSN
jgi:serine/threonine-protein phosphatase 5